MPHRESTKLPVRVVRLKLYKLTISPPMRNIAWGATEPEIRKIMESAGRIVCISLPNDEKGRQKGHKIIEYASKEMADKARKTLNKKKKRKGQSN